MADEPKKLWIGDQDWYWLISTVARIDRNVSRLLDMQTATLAKVSDGFKVLVGASAKVEVKMSAVDDAVSALATQVEANTNAEASAVALISELAGLIQQHVDNPEALTELAAKLKASADALAAAVSANTPAPAPAPEPAE